VQKNSLKTYYPRHYSAVSDVDANLTLLRNRAFDLAINSPLGAAAITSMVTGVLGNGLELFPVPKVEMLGLTAESARRWADKTKLEFEVWANSLNCDFSRRNNFYELQRITLASSFTDGDAFILFRRRFSNANPYSLRLQVLESQRVSNPNTGYGVSNCEMLLPNGNRVVNGIEVDRAGRLQALHVSNKIWNEPQTVQAELEWRRVRFFGENGNQNALMIAFDTRADMFRGAPLLSPVIETLKQIARFSEAELSSAIIKSFFSLFFTQNSTSLDINQILPQEEELNLKEYKLGAGTLNALPRNVDVKSVESNNAQSTFEIFLNSFIKQVGAALGIPFEVLLQNYNASYSASRAALLQAEQTFKQRRAAFVQDFCQPIYENFLIEAVASGRINAPGFFEDPVKRYCWSAADWRREVMPGIDALKDANAAKVRIETGISSRKIECIRLGNDYDEVARSLDG
jgi:lambda family phage portal protein